jgi:hypothetical protein
MTLFSVLVEDGADRFEPDGSSATIHAANAAFSGNRDQDIKR